MASTDMKLSQVLQKAECGEPLSSQELQFLLSLSEPHELNQVFKLARSLRNRYFENKVFYTVLSTSLHGVAMTVLFATIENLINTPRDTVKRSLKYWTQL